MKAWTEHLKPEDLPGDLSEIARIIGVASALKLADSFGGGTVHIPKAKSIDDPDKIIFIIADLIGEERVMKLAESFGGETIYVSQAKSVIDSAKRSFILDNPKMAVYKLRMITGYSDRQIIRIRKNVKVIQDSNQISLIK